MRQLFAILAGLLIVGTTLAQEQIAPPKFPLQLRAPENAQWTVNCEPKSGNIESKEGADKEPFVTRLDITKTGPIYHEIATVKNGQGWEKWTFLIANNQYGLVQYGGSAKWERLSPAGTVLAATDYSRSDFEELQWMGQETYKGVTEVEKTKYFLFETNTNKGPLTSREAYHYDYGAASDAIRDGKTYGTNLPVLGYLSVTNQLPAKFDNGTEIRKYSFSDPPASRQQPPPPVVQDLAKWMAEIKARQR